MMNKKNMDIAEAYYVAMGAKNVDGLKDYLHPHVKFSSPFATVDGKEALVEWIKKFTTFFKTLSIRAKFGSEDQAMIVYDLDFPAPIGQSSAAALFTFQEGLIVGIELFFDARPFNS